MKEKEEEQLNLDELLTDVWPCPTLMKVFTPNRQVDEDRNCVMNDNWYEGYRIVCGCEDSDPLSQCAEDTCFGYASVGFDVNGAVENDAEEVGMIQKDYALRMAKTMAAAPLLLRTVKKQNEELFWLTDTMDESQRQDTDNLKQRAVHPSIADFIQRMAEWGFNNVEHTMLWEAMVSVIEAGERGDLDDLIDYMNKEE